MARHSGELARKWREVSNSKKTPPEYDQNNSLLTLPRTILNAFTGQKVEGVNKQLLELVQEASRVLLLIVDSLGLNLVVKGGLSSLIKDSSYSTYLTSTVPSTTATAIASLATGEAPLLHLSLGYKMYLKEVGAIIKPLKFSPVIGGPHESLREAGVSISLNPCKTVFERLSTSGIKCYYVGPQSIGDTTYTRSFTKGATFIESISLEDTLTLALKALKKSNETLVYAYWDKLDKLSHEYGPFSKPVEYLLTGFEKVLTELLRDLRQVKNSVLIVTSDHGQISLRGGKRIFLTEVLGFLENLYMPPYGESRFLYLHVKKEKKFLEIFKTYLEPFAELYRISDILHLFAPEKKRTPENVETFLDHAGTHALIPRENNVLIYPYAKRDLEFDLKGHHGGLSPHEMLIPLIIFVNQ